jgi:hypothetical protein
MSNISPQKNACTPEKYISLRNLCENFWLEETAIFNIASCLQTNKTAYIFYSLHKT